ncbi:MAG: septum formation inhibitor Maf [Leptolyngbyaceae cyanobacterium SM1_1_3]|nr:septum formation inhibitor Maf [Leptolyngbyaceae cyanobacterium SM1_1_3]NJN01397.1 septum formation inhibitor Maf [Leptolyngbyaceae cyanobacterium RM1_1_2]NJO11156.1 septum formation inhibitor Maf [Leptolyngbyaceae cyanobacterium SL_1_1]
MMPQFVLASASPARRQLLVAAGIQPFVCPSRFDEDQIQLADPAELVQALALSKAETVAPQFSNALVLGCDSLLYFDKQIYGKPESAGDAIARWQKMRGQMGELYTGHVLIDTQNQRQQVRCQVSRVFFAAVSDRQIEAYVASREPLNCAGAFTIDGKGSLFVEKIEGCYTNIIGLSMPLLRQMLGDLGYGVTDFW